MKTANPPIDAITAALLAAHGELIGGRALWQALGLKSDRTFLRLAKADRLPVRTFFVQGRRERLARTRDVGAWLLSLGEGALAPELQGGDSMAD